MLCHRFGHNRTSARAAHAFGSAFCRLQCHSVPVVLESKRRSCHNHSPLAQSSGARPARRATSEKTSPAEVFVPDNRLKSLKNKRYDCETPLQLTNNTDETITTTEVRFRLRFEGKIVHAAAQTTAMAVTEELSMILSIIPLGKSSAKNCRKSPLEYSRARSFVRDQDEKLLQMAFQLKHHRMCIELAACASNRGSI